MVATELVTENFQLVLAGQISATFGCVIGTLNPAIFCQDKRLPLISFLQLIYCFFPPHIDLVG